MSINILTESDLAPLAAQLGALSSSIEALTVRVAALEAAPAGAGGVRIDAYHSPDHGELVDHLEPNNVKATVFSVPIGDVKAGDIVIGLGEISATNNMGVNAHWAADMRLTDAADSTTGIEIAENNSFNITPDMHHGKHAKVGAVVVPHDIANARVNLNSWASKGMSIIERDCGRLAVVVIRK